MTEIYDLAAKMVEEETDWQRISETLLPKITTRFDLENIGLLPQTDRILVASNHPSHMDYFLTGDALVKRPDLKIVARVPTEEQERTRFPSRRKFLSTSEQFIPLHSGANASYVHDSLDYLGDEMRDGRSAIVVPWGAMDHQENERHSLERSIDNIVHLTRLSGASVMTSRIDITSQSNEQWPGPLPFSRVKVVLSEPIPAGQESKIADAIAALYPQATK